MKRIVSIIVAVVMLAATSHAQLSIYNLDATNDGQVVSFDTSNAVGLMDNGGNGRYQAGDYSITVTSQCGTYRFYFKIDELDISCTDTLYFYDGPSTSSPIIAKVNNCTGASEGDFIYVSPTNVTGAMTVRFYSAQNTNGGDGFNLSVGCGKPCETVIPVIDSVFYRTRRGVVYDSAKLRQVPEMDTLWNINAQGDTLSFTIDTSYFTGAHLCIGDGVIFRGHGVYSYKYGYYTPSDATSFFTWNLDDEGDTIKGVGITEIEYNDYQKTNCYTMTLSIVDVFGCESTVYTAVKVRTASNPIKTIFTLSDICNRDSLLVSMGYDGENATLTLREVETNMSVSKVNDVRTFIPDGPSCPPGYYLAPVTFTEFPGSKRVQTADDICSICINMEHSFMGDITVSIVCPTGQEAMLFWGNQDSRIRDGNTTNGAGAGGSGKYMGYPVENGGLDSGNKCDSLTNPFGEGLDYCFSRNNDYMLVTGVPAGSVIGRPPGTHYITASAFMDNFNTTVTIPSHFSNQGGTTVSVSGTTKHPSDHVGKLDYYVPYTDFTELVGCPLNGTWAIKVHDQWGVDNGWVFNWSLDICNVTREDDCTYTVGIDSLIWTPNPAPQYHDYDLGHYRGLEVYKATPVKSYIYSRDTAGVFPIDVILYDEFGCKWDTTTQITTHWTPMPDLGADTMLCGVDRMMLDATDAHTATQNYSYRWSPYGESTPVIQTAESAPGDVQYVVEVANEVAHGNMVCQSRDTINIAVRKQPMPNFVTESFQFEGCAPLTITFENQSVDASSYRWEFGDNVVSELASPTHTYDEGIYTLKYYAISEDGCVDSIVVDNGVAVYATPKAAFSWEPVYPSVLQPTVNFQNNTTPQTGNTRYTWEVQYNPDNPLSFETLNTHNASFNFSNYAGNDVAGNYNVHLIASSENIAPSGNVVRCSDTAANNVLVINDFLQFPNVVTPNGDGVNDRFVIQNLVDGLGYPINSLDIYNKWGARVYHRENISRDEDFWDPADMPDGTYFYRFSASGYNGNIEHNGAIEVIH